MAQFVTHIQPTLVEASQGHMPHHHGHQVGLQHQSHLPHSGHNMPSPPTHNYYHNQHNQQQLISQNKRQNTYQVKYSHDNFSTGHLVGDGNTSFLRSARAGNLEKVLEHLKNNIDINTCNTNGLNALHLASKDGHVNVVSELLKRGAIVDSATKKGNTALHIASLAGQEEVVKLLIQASASVNVQSQNGFTPLYMAAQENHDSVVKLLLANGANQSLATEDGFTPLAVAMQQGHDKVVAVLLESDTRGKVRLPALHIAAKKDDVKAAALLLENDHNPDITSKSGFTPLHIASHYGNQSIANLLIQKGADVNYLAKHNISPLHVAAKWGKTNMVSVLLEKGANIEAKTRDGLTPLHCAARSGHEQVVDMLLERGAPISAKTKNGLAPLHMAAQGEHVDAARILLYHRAPVDEVTVDYLTALHVAAHCGHVRVAKLLLDRNADANARALNGFTPLHIACKKNRIKVVELLLRHGASISATTESGLTPLHVAAFMGCMNIVIYLLQHDASPDVPTVRGETPLHLAARANQTDIIRILLRNGAQVDARAREQQTPLHIASRLGNVDIVMLLLQHGAQVDATTKDMYTALHIAAKEGQDEVSAVLIENGAVLDSSTKKGFTPLHLAAKYGHIKVAQFLLQKDADVDAQGKNGVTPLHVACHYDKQNVALLLLERGASPHAPAKNGHTPLHIAARKNQMDIATTLLEYGAYADTESKAGFTPLHLSSQEGHSEISSLLIEHKANCNHGAKNGLTPMHLCAQEDNVNVAEVIFRNGANIDMITKAGYTPLHVASHFGQSNMVRFLLQKSANVDAATTIGYTPLHQAAQQGHCHIVNLLLEHKANANAQTANGQTPLHIAKKLGYISVLDSLKSMTNEDYPDPREQHEDKYRVVAPEAMHETFMSDSEEEGGEDTALSDQPYRYLTVDEMKSLGDDSLPIDVTRDERIDSNRMAQSNENVPRQAIEETISPHRAEIFAKGKSNTGSIDISVRNQEIVRRKLQWKNFLVSFLVDARGGAMRGCRHSGVKMIIPSRSTCQPTRVTCRYVKPQRTMHPPQLMEGEALASRVLELGPVSVKFQGPVIMEVPHFASLRGKEREIIILRSDNGETWREHNIDSSEEIIQDVLNDCFEAEEISQLNEQSVGHVCRFVTYDFPQYFAVVSRIRQEVHAIGSEGGMVSSTVVPQVQAVFPQGALTKKIKVGLQAQPVDPDLTAKLLGRGVAVSPIVTVEPRRRKFHKAITLSMPAPKAHSQGMINQYSGNTPTLRLLCSITGGASRAQWEDVTGSTPLTFVNDCVSFTTTVSARFWLMDCRNISEATKMATELYREVIHVPFMAKFVVFAKRVESNEARLRVFCMSDDREDKTLEKQELFTEVAKSRDVEVLEGKPQYIEMAGNLVPVTKSGEQLQLIFKAFRENRLSFAIRVKDQHADIVGRTLFMKEPKVAKGEPPQHPICILNIILPEIVVPDQSALVKLRSDYSQSDDRNYRNNHYIGDMRIVDLSNLLGKDYIKLAPEIGISESEMSTIVKKHANSIARQAQDMIRLFKDKPHYDIYMLEYALKTIGREDILEKCKVAEIHNYPKWALETDVEPILDETSTRIQRIHESEEMKYSAEEKDVTESESDEENPKRTVAERREKIVKRLSIERQIPASSQKKEIFQEITEIKRKSLIEDKKAIHEEEIMLQMPTDNIIKSTVSDHIVKMKLNKLETTEVSKIDFDKELNFKFKTTMKRMAENENNIEDNLKSSFKNEAPEKEDKYTTNELIRKSSPHSSYNIESTENVNKGVSITTTEVEEEILRKKNTLSDLIMETNDNDVVQPEGCKHIDEYSDPVSDKQGFKSILDKTTKNIVEENVVVHDELKEIAKEDNKPDEEIIDDTCLVPVKAGTNTFEIGNKFAAAFDEAKNSSFHSNTLQNCIITDILKQSCNNNNVGSYKMDEINNIFKINEDNYQPNSNNILEKEKGSHKVRKLVNLLEYPEQLVDKNNILLMPNDGLINVKKCVNKIESSHCEAMPFPTKQEVKNRHPDLKNIEDQITDYIQNTERPGNLKRIVTIIGEEQTKNLESIGEEICEIKCTKKNIPQLAKKTESNVEPLESNTSISEKHFLQNTIKNSTTFPTEFVSWQQDTGFPMNNAGKKVVKSESYRRGKIPLKDLKKKNQIYNNERLSEILDLDIQKEVFPVKLGQSEDENVIYQFLKFPINSLCLAPEDADQANSKNDKFQILKKNEPDKSVSFLFHINEVTPLPNHCCTKTSFVLKKNLNLQTIMQSCTPCQPVLLNKNKHQEMFADSLLQKANLSKITTFSYSAMQKDAFIGINTSRLDRQDYKEIINNEKGNEDGSVLSDYISNPLVLKCDKHSRFMKDTNKSRTFTTTKLKPERSEKTDPIIHEHIQPLLIFNETVYDNDDKPIIQSPSNTKRKQSPRYKIVSHTMPISRFHDNSNYALTKCEHKEQESQVAKNIINVDFVKFLGANSESKNKIYVLSTNLTTRALVKSYENSITKGNLITTLPFVTSDLVKMPKVNFTKLMEQNLQVDANRCIQSDGLLKFFAKDLVNEIEQLSGKVLETRLNAKNLLPRRKTPTQEGQPNRHIKLMTLKNTKIYIIRGIREKMCAALNKTTISRTNPILFDNEQKFQPSEVYVKEICYAGKFGFRSHIWETQFKTYNNEQTTSLCHKSKQAQKMMVSESDINSPQDLGKLKYRKLIFMTGECDFQIKALAQAFRVFENMDMNILVISSGVSFSNFQFSNLSVSDCDLKKSDRLEKNIFFSDKSCRKCISHAAEKEQRGPDIALQDLSISTLESEGWERSTSRNVNVSQSNFADPFYSKMALFDLKLIEYYSYLKRKEGWGSSGVTSKTLILPFKVKVISKSTLCWGDLNAYIYPSIQVLKRKYRKDHADFFECRSDVAKKPETHIERANKLNWYYLAKCLKSTGISQYNGKEKLQLKMPFEFQSNDIPNVGAQQRDNNLLTYKLEFPASKHMQNSKERSNKEAYVKPSTISSYNICPFQQLSFLILKLNLSINKKRKHSVSKNQILNSEFQLVNISTHNSKEMPLSASQVEAKFYIQTPSVERFQNISNFLPEPVNVGDLIASICLESRPVIFHSDIISEDLNFQNEKEYNVISQFNDIYFLVNDHHFKMSKSRESKIDIWQAETLLRSPIKHYVSVDNTNIVGNRIEREHFSKNTIKENIAPKQYFGQKSIVTKMNEDISKSKKYSNSLFLSTIYALFDNELIAFEEYNAKSSTNDFTISESLRSILEESQETSTKLKFISYCRDFYLDIFKAKGDFQFYENKHKNMKIKSYKQVHIVSSSVLSKLGLALLTHIVPRSYGYPLESICFIYKDVTSANNEQLSILRTNSQDLFTILHVENPKFVFHTAIFNFQFKTEIFRNLGTKNEQSINELLFPPNIEVKSGSPKVMPSLNPRLLETAPVVIKSTPAFILSPLSLCTKENKRKSILQNSDLQKKKRNEEFTVDLTDKFIFQKPKNKKPNIEVTQSKNDEKIRTGKEDLKEDTTSSRCCPQEFSDVKYNAEILNSNAITKQAAAILRAVSLKAMPLIIEDQRASKELKRKEPTLRDISVFLIDKGSKAVSLAKIDESTIEQPETTDVYRPQYNKMLQPMEKHMVSKVQQKVSPQRMFFTSLDNFNPPVRDIHDSTIKLEKGIHFCHSVNHSQPKKAVIDKKQKVSYSNLNSDITKRLTERHSHYNNKSKTNICSSENKFDLEIMPQYLKNNASSEDDISESLNYPLSKTRSNKQQPGELSIQPTNPLKKLMQVKQHCIDSIKSIKSASLSEEKLDVCTEIVKEECLIVSTQQYSSNIKTTISKNSISCSESTKSKLNDTSATSRNHPASYFVELDSAVKCNKTQQIHCLSKLCNIKEPFPKKVNLPSCIEHGMDDCSSRKLGLRNSIVPKMQPTPTQISEKFSKRSTSIVPKTSKSNIFPQISERKKLTTSKILTIQLQKDISKGRNNLDEKTRQVKKEACKNKNKMGKESTEQSTIHSNDQSSKVNISDRSYMKPTISHNLKSEGNRKSELSGPVKHVKQDKNELINAVKSGSAQRNSISNILPLKCGSNNFFADNEKKSIAENVKDIQRVQNKEQKLSTEKYEDNKTNGVTMKKIISELPKHIKHRKPTDTQRNVDNSLPVKNKVKKLSKESDGKLIKVNSSTQTRTKPTIKATKNYKDITEVKRLISKDFVNQNEKKCDKNINHNLQSYGRDNSLNLKLKNNSVIQNPVPKCDLNLKCTPKKNVEQSNIHVSEAVVKEKIQKKCRYKTNETTKVDWKHQSVKKTECNIKNMPEKEVVTCEVITKSFCSDRSIEVVFGQPSLNDDDDDLELTRKNFDCKNNEFDASFIDTTDSSLSDSVALSFYAIEQERNNIMSPGSPKPTKDPLLLIEHEIENEGLYYDCTKINITRSTRVPTEELDELHTAGTVDKDTSHADILNENNLMTPTSFQTIDDTVAKESTQADNFYEENSMKPEKFQTNYVTITEGTAQAGNLEEDTSIKYETLKATDGTFIKVLTQPDDLRECSSIKPKSIQSSDEPKMDLIRKEATMLINKVLEESIFIINHQQQDKLTIKCKSDYAIKHDDYSETIQMSPSQTLFDDDLCRKEENSLQNTTLEKSAIPLPVVLQSVQEQRTEETFQELFSLDNIGNRVESFDLTSDVMVHADKIGSIYQNFSKITRSETISTITSTLTETSANIPVNDIQDFYTDTGEEIAKCDSNDLSYEIGIMDIIRPPRPTPRTLNTEGVLQESKQSHETNKELPIPRPRQQKNLELQSNENITEAFSPSHQTINEVNVSDRVTSVLQNVSSIKPLEDLMESELKCIQQQFVGGQSDLNIANIDMKEEMISLADKSNTVESLETSEPKFPLQPESEESLLMNVAIHHGGLEFKDKQLIKSDNRDGLEELPLNSSNNLGLKRSPMLSDAHSESIKLKSNEDLTTVTIEAELQTSFYIGESSNNIIIRSKPSEKDEEFTEENAPLIEKSCEITRSSKSVDEESQEETSAQDVKVIRQWSETRNDLLEVETVSQKACNESDLQTDEAFVKIVLENDKTSNKEFEAINMQIDKDTQQQNKIDSSAINRHIPKAGKLDLVLDKSELEMSEKSCVFSNAKICSDMKETVNTELLSDVLLVERTLEEVQLSLDAAKEELIQVVRDGKSIKQSPSEFEFKNISHAKSNLTHCLEEKGDDIQDARIGILDHITETDLHIDDDANILDECLSSGTGEAIKSVDFSHQSATKITSPLSNRWSLHDVDNSSSSDSHYKSGSRPGSSDFDTVQTFHTSSEYQTAFDGSICRGSTEYVSAANTFNSSGKSISSHESMKSLSSETSGNLGSIDTSDLSETLIASIGDPDIEFEIDNENLEVLEEDLNIQRQEESHEHESLQNCMKRSQEMIFPKEELQTSLTKVTQDNVVYKKAASPLEESNILSTPSTSIIDSDVNNCNELVGSAGLSSLERVEKCTAINEDVSIQSYEKNDMKTSLQDEHLFEQPEQDQSDNISIADEPRRRGHKRNESTSVGTELIKKLLEDDAENSTSEDLENNANIASKLSGDDQKGSESESDHDPYESEYSRAFKSPSQRKKKKDKKHEALDQSPDHTFGQLLLATQTIIEDVVTEEMESQITADEERRPSQNMQDYSNIPDITVTEEMIKFVEETKHFPDSALYKVKTQVELHKVEDTPIQRTTEVPFSISDEQFNELVQEQYKQKLADLNECHEFDTRAPDSPDSFEMVDQPEITDEFVIIEEVAKEASELDEEGKSIKISSSKIVRKHDEEVEQILIKSAPAATNLGSQLFREDLNFDFEESPPSAQAQSEADSAEIAANKKWVEMQLSDQTAQLRYPYELERGILEDIKEEDNEFDVGSSRISSFKDSFSSTPDYDVLAGKKYFSKAEHDDISMNSLQEFENLEQAISLENRRIYQGSTDSSNGSFTRRYMMRNPGGDDISLSSLKEFEGLENACIEAHLIEIKAKEEAALLLSRSDESNGSNNAHESAPNVVITTRLQAMTKFVTKNNTATILKSKLEECEDTKLFLKEDLETEASTSMTKLGEPRSEHSSADSLELNKSIKVTTGSIDSLDIQKDMAIQSDVGSLSVTDVKFTTTDETFVEFSIPTKMTGAAAIDISDQMSKDISNDSLNLCVEQTSSAATNATYCNDGDSLMSDSMNSCCSSTLIEDNSISTANQSLTQQDLLYLDELQRKDESSPKK